MEKEIPNILWKNSGVVQKYKLEDGTFVTHRICISFGDDKVWISAEILEDGTPYLEFSNFNMKNPPLINKE